MKRGALIALILAASLGGAEAAGLDRLPPPEAVPTEAAALHAEIQRIVAARDLEALAALADPEIKLSFGGEYGVDTLREWSGEEWFWPEWTRITAYPPSIAGEGVGAYLAYPWYFAEWPGRFDSYDYMIAAEGAVLLDRPIADSAVIADLSFAIVPDDVEDAAPEGWRRLCATDTGPCGFVEDASLASPIGWRAIFQVVDGRWRMTAFIAGD